MYSPIRTYLRTTLQGTLPGAVAHQKLLPPGRRLKSLDHEILQVKPSSVLLLLYPEGDRIFTCLTKRPTTMRFHPGQISFPGGKVEKDDISVEMTALREAQEEIGINPSSIEIIGKLTDLYLEVSQFSIQPILAWTNQKPEFFVNTSEVEDLILFPISDYVVNETIMETELDTITGTLLIKYYPFNGEIIWGATAMILSELIEIMKKNVNNNTRKLQ